jgi:hypothetical protein
MNTAPGPGFSAMVLSSSPSDTTVLRFGGTTTSEVYHSGTATWALTGSMNSVRTSFGAAKLANGNVFVAGGKTPSYTSTTEEYSPATGTWTVRASMSDARSSFSLTFLAGINKLLAVAGTGVSGPMTTAELYTP